MKRRRPLIDKSVTVERLFQRGTHARKELRSYNYSNERSDERNIRRVGVQSTQLIAAGTVFKDDSSRFVSKDFGTLGLARKGCIQKRSSQKDKLADSNKGRILYSCAIQQTRRLIVVGFKSTLTTTIPRYHFSLAHRRVHE